MNSMILIKTRFGSDTDIIFQQQDRIVKIHYPIISEMHCRVQM